MTNEEILKKAMKKAVKNGYCNGSYELPFLISFKNEWKTILDNGLFYRIIFSHDFAKAFWGKEIIIYDEDWEKWQWELMRMALEKEPLLYIAKFL